MGWFWAIYGPFRSNNPHHAAALTNHEALLIMQRHDHPRKSSLTLPKQPSNGECWKHVHGNWFPVIVCKEIDVKILQWTIISMYHNIVPWQGYTKGRYRQASSHHASVRRTLVMWNARPYLWLWRVARFLAVFLPILNAHTNSTISYPTMAVGAPSLRAMPFWLY